MSTFRSNWKFSKVVGTSLDNFGNIQKSSEVAGRFSEIPYQDENLTQKKLVGRKSCYSFVADKPAFAAVKPDILNRPQSDYFALYLPTVGYWQKRKSHFCHHSLHMKSLDQKCMFCLAWMLQCFYRWSNWAPRLILSLCKKSKQRNKIVHYCSKKKLYLQISCTSSLQGLLLHKFMKNKI